MGSQGGGVSLAAQGGPAGGEFAHTVGGSVKCYTLFGKQSGSFLNRNLP